MRNRQLRPLIISGLPRSGTTWVGQIVSAPAAVSYLFEPDNEKTSPLAWLHKQQVHRFPYLRAGDESPLYKSLWETLFTSAVERSLRYRLFERIFRQMTVRIERDIGDKCGLSYWDSCYNGVGRLAKEPIFNAHFKRLLIRIIPQVGSGKRRMKNGRLIIKTVHAPFALSWMVGNFDVDILLVLRNPHSLLASYKRMKMPDANRNLLFQPALRDAIGDYLNQPVPPLITPTDVYIFQLLLGLKIMASQLSTHPKWQTISHDRLCLDPIQGYRQLFSDLELLWSNQIEIRLMQMNRQGVGFSTLRETALQATKWQSELSTAEILSVERWIDIFELRGFLEQYVT